MSRENILRAAATIFQEKGYHATSMQDIAEAVELKKGSLYHHVNSKQEILLALLDEALGLIVERLEDVSSPDYLPQLKNYAQCYASIFRFFNRKPISFFCPSTGIPLPGTRI